MRKSNGFTRGDGGENQVVRVVVRSEIDGDGGRGRARGAKGEGRGRGRRRPQPRTEDGLGLIGGVSGRGNERATTEGGTDGQPIKRK